MMHSAERGKTAPGNWEGRMEHTSTAASSSSAQDDLLMFFFAFNLGIILQQPRGNWVRKVCRTHRRSPAQAEDEVLGWCSLGLISYH